MVLDPIIGGYHFHTSPDGRWQQSKPDISGHYPQNGDRTTKICHSNTTFKGVTPGPGAHCTGTLLLEVIFGFPDNFCSENLTFHIAPFQSGYQALLGREAVARFNAIPHYASLMLKMPGPRGIITVNGNIERSLRAEDRAAALASAHQNGLSN